jgi:hypothetical protein
MEDAWIDWAHLDGYDMLERLRGEGYKWQYVGHDIPDDLDVPDGYVLITDEFPEGDVLVSKKLLDPRLAREHGIVAITPATRRGVAKKRIMDYYQGRTGPIVVTTPGRSSSEPGLLVGVVHKSTRRPGTWQGSKFDKDGPYGHHEGDTEEKALDELIEMGFTVPEAGGMKRILGAVGNPPYSGYDAIYFRRPMPDDITKISYKKKRDALNVFLDWNRGIVDDYGGEDQKHNYASFDAINHQFDIQGKRRVNTIAKAVWWVLPSGSPYYLEDIDVELLNRTAPAIFNPRGLHFTLPDYAEEARLLEQQAEYWEERYGLPEDDEAPF